VRDQRSDVAAAGGRQRDDVLRCVRFQHGWPGKHIQVSVRAGILNSQHADMK
jgi:hypothetical protein